MKDRKQSRDDIGDRVPNDWLEAVILFIVGLGLFGSVIALYHLWETAQAMP